RLVLVGILLRRPYKQVMIDGMLRFWYENLDVAKFKEKSPEYLDEIEFIFEDVVATSVDNDKNNDNDEDNDNELNDESTPPSAMRQKRRKVGRDDKRLGASQLSTQLERIINVISNSSTENLSTKSLISNTNVSNEEFENKQKVATKRKKTVTLITIVICVDYFLKYVVKNPRRTSRLTENSWVNKLLNGHPISCYQQFRMKKHVFLYFYDVLQNTYNLRTTKGIEIHEQV
ncbi:hypothetical protein S83_019922, partial [Arachis hypogaea]